MGRDAAKVKDHLLSRQLNLSGGSLEDVIRVRGARQHNLKNVDITLPPVSYTHLTLPTKA